MTRRHSYQQLRGEDGETDDPKDDPETGFYQLTRQMFPNSCADGTTDKYAQNRVGDNKPDRRCNLPRMHNREYNRRRLSGVIESIDDGTEGDVRLYRFDADLDGFTLVSLGDDHHVAALDTRDPIALVADILDLDNAGLTLADRWLRL